MPGADSFKRLYRERRARVEALNDPKLAVQFDLHAALGGPMEFGEITRLWFEHFRELERGIAAEPVHVYVHTPFCGAKCKYCIYYSRPLTGRDDLFSYAAAVAREAELFGALARGRPVSSLCFGGGTPSIYPDDVFDFLLECVFGSFRLVPGALVSCEMNPHTATPAKIASAARRGVNRISFGVQSLTPEVLEAAGRRYQTLESVEAAISTAKGAGVPNVNADMIAYLDGETPESLAAGIEKLAGLRPTSITLYNRIFTGAEQGKGGEAAMPEGWERTARLFAGIVSRLGYDVDTRDIKTHSISAGLAAHQSHATEIGTGVFSLSPRSVLGLGAASFSFIFGRAAYKKPRSSFIEHDKYTGYRTDPANEARLALIQYCSTNVPVPVAQFVKWHGARPEDLRPAEMSALAELGVAAVGEREVNWSGTELELIAAASLFYSEGEFEKIMEAIVSPGAAAPPAPRGGSIGGEVAATGHPHGVASKTTPRLTAELAAFAGLEGSGGGAALIGAELTRENTILLRLLHDNTSVTELWVERRSDRPGFARTAGLSFSFTGDNVPPAVTDIMPVIAFRLREKTFDDLLEYFPVTFYT